jgi:hypothetical protein
MKKFLILILCTFIICGCSKSSDVITEEEISSNNIISTASENLNDSEFSTYMDDVKEEVNNILESSDISSSDEGRLRNTFITLTDFIFYDGEIKGKTFSELGYETKLKVMEVYTEIDEKISEKFPNYKDNIKTTTSNTYNNLKDKTSELKNKILDEYKSYVGEDAYQEVIDSYEDDKSQLNDVYETYKPYVETGKEKAKSTYEKVKEKVSNWYSEFKESGE